MLPNSGFNSYGYAHDVRGFKKKTKPLKVLQQYAPVLALFELLILLVVIVTYNSSVKYGNHRNAALQLRMDAREEENRNLMSSLSQERQSRVSVETRLRDATNRAAAAQKELQDFKSTSAEKDTHSQSLQQSFETTRLSLEAERDAARYEARSLSDRVAALQRSLAALDRNAAERERINAIHHQEKDATHASKEAAWETMRKTLEAQVKAQGGYVAASQGQQQHPDYAAQTGSQAFHPSHNGQQERFIDTASDLEQEGVTDPLGKSHLAELLGHLFDLKMHEYAAMETHPGELNPPKPPIGHWMAQNLERNGVTCRYGTVHMAYILDRHFTLEAKASAVGRGNTPQQTGQAQPGGIAGGNLGGQAQQNPQGTNPVQQDSSFGRASMETPGVVQDSTKRDIENGKAAREKLEQERLHAWRSKHKVDAAGFV